MVAQECSGLSFFDGCSLIIAFFTFSTQRTFRFLQQCLNPLGHHSHPQQIKRLSNTTLVLYYSQSVIMENSCISNICRTNRWFVLVYCMQIVIMKNLLRSPKTVQWVQGCEKQSRMKDIQCHSQPISESFTCYVSRSK